MNESKPYWLGYHAETPPSLAVIHYLNCYCLQLKSGVGTSGTTRHENAAWEACAAFSGPPQWPVQAAHMVQKYRSKVNVSARPFAMHRKFEGSTGWVASLVETGYPTPFFFSLYTLAACSLVVRLTLNDHFNTSCLFCCSCRRRRLQCYQQPQSHKLPTQTSMTTLELHFNRHINWEKSRAEL